MSVNDEFCAKVDKICGFVMWGISNRRRQLPAMWLVPYIDCIDVS